MDFNNNAHVCMWAAMLFPFFPIRKEENQMYYFCLVICLIHQNRSLIRSCNVIVITLQLQHFSLTPFSMTKDCYVYQYLVSQDLDYVYFGHTPGCIWSQHLVLHLRSVILQCLHGHYIMLLYICYTTSSVVSSAQCARHS